VVVAWKYLYEYYAFILRRSTKGITEGFGLKKKQANKFYVGKFVSLVTTAMPLQEKKKTTLLKT
jgi:hypothetical protein